jgi:prepilin-type N-terminal cleavage/methylation domain-containing protein
MRRGFTLLEVVVALLVLDVAAVGVAGTLAIASRTLGRAERLEHAVSLAEGVLDSLSRVRGPFSSALPYDGGQVRWEVRDSGPVVLSALGPEGDTLFVVTSTLPLR